MYYYFRKYYRYIKLNNKIKLNLLKYNTLNNLIKIDWIS